jgi:hypothetical protein
VETWRPIKTVSEMNLTLRVARKRLLGPLRESPAYFIPLSYRSLAQFMRNPPPDFGTRIKMLGKNFITIF